MVLAALLSFGILLLAWILAPDGVRPTAHPEPRTWEMEAQTSY